MANNDDSDFERRIGQGKGNGEVCTCLATYKEITKEALYQIGNVAITFTCQKHGQVTIDKRDTVYRHCCNCANRPNKGWPRSI